MGENWEKLILTFDSMLAFKYESLWTVLLNFQIKVKMYWHLLSAEKYKKEFIIWLFIKKSSKSVNNIPKSNIFKIR